VSNCSFLQSSSRLHLQSAVLADKIDGPLPRLFSVHNVLQGVNEEGIKLEESDKSMFEGWTKVCSRSFTS
jgi:hypothetical protein